MEEEAEMEAEEDPPVSDFGAARAEAERTSVKSFTRALKIFARSAQAGSSRNNWPYSFIVEPQPAAFTTIQSSFSRSNVSMFWRAHSRAESSFPLCENNAPQHCWSPGVITSYP